MNALLEMTEPFYRKAAAPVRVGILREKFGIWNQYWTRTNMCDVTVAVQCIRMSYKSVITLLI